MKKQTVAAAIFAVFAIASGAEAQNWDTPSYLGPDPGADLGLYVVDGSLGAVGFQGVWRRTEGVNLGLRLGFVDAGNGVLQLGAETWGDIVVDPEEFPLDIIWTAGVGANLNAGPVIGVPIGVSIGKTFMVSELPVQVYGHPRAVLRAYEDAADELTLDVDGEFDIGIDMLLSDRIKLRVGASLGWADALGIGLAWRQ